MIRIDVPARMCCVATDCSASHPVELILLAGGGFGIRPPMDAKLWQLLLAPGGGPLQPMLARCPDHVMATSEIQAPKLQVGPAGPRIRLPRDNGHH